MFLRLVTGSADNLFSTPHWNGRNRTCTSSRYSNRPECSAIELRSESRLLAESASLLSLTGFLRHCHRSYVPVAPIRLLPLFDRLTCCQSAIGFNFRFEHDRTGNRSGRIRTCDTISSSQLSYAPIFAGLSWQSERFSFVS